MNESNVNEMKYLLLVSYPLMSIGLTDYSFQDYVREKTSLLTIEFYSSGVEQSVCPLCFSVHQDFDNFPQSCIHFSDHHSCN